MKSRGWSFSSFIGAALVAGCQPSDEELAARYEGVVQSYCLECHDVAGREAGLSLENVDLDDVAAHPVVFVERRAQAARGGKCPPRVVRGPMRRRTTDSLAYLETAPGRGRALAGYSSPARPGIHRLNRTEYGNAIRDLLALDIDATELLPADDEATASTTSRTSCGVAVAARTVPGGVAQDRRPRRRRPRPGGQQRRYRVPPDLAQADHVEGLPLGTRGGISIATTSRSTPTTNSASILLRNIVGYMTGLEWPHELEIAIDGERVFLAPVGGEEDNELSDTNMSAAGERDRRALADARVQVTAGPHESAWRSSRRARAESRRAAAAVHAQSRPAGHERRALVDYVEDPGPFDATGLRRHAEPPADLHVPAREPPRDEAAMRDRRSSRRSRTARIGARSTEQDIDAAARFYEAGRKRRHLRRRHRRRAARSSSTSPKFLFRDEPDPAETSRPARSTRSATSSSRRGCRSSSGAACPTTSC